jgi:bifunctional DNA-binding transcriptional regulator/antitoxin component of YhaV-PrlF toxin-antitoxin module
MSDTSAITMGRKGRLVIPAPVRSRHDWGEGTVLIGFDDGDGFKLMSRDSALSLVRQQLAGASLVDELVAERREQPLRDQPVA